MFSIAAKEILAPTVTRFRVLAPYVARKRRPGHFVIVRIAPGGERIPLTIADSEPETGLITLIVQAVGKTTAQLCDLGVGDRISDVLGPLGQATPIENHGAVACVGGGVGTAVVLPIARALHAAGNTVYGVLGARSKDLLILERELEACSHELSIVTDDGSYGRKGVVTQPLADLLARPLGIKVVYAVGPLPMMRAVAELTRPLGIHTVVSLNPIMVDGTGMCGGCRVSVEGKIRFACVDGPEFDAHGVDFDELQRRSRQYVRQECESRRLYEAAHAPSEARR